MGRRLRWAACRGRPDGAPGSTGARSGVAGATPGRAASASVVGVDGVGAVTVAAGGGTAISAASASAVSPSFFRRSGSGLSPASSSAFTAARVLVSLASSAMPCGVACAAASAVGSTVVPVGSAGVEALPAAGVPVVPSAATDPARSWSIRAARKPSELSPPARRRAARLPPSLRGSRRRRSTCRR